MVKLVYLHIAAKKCCISAFLSTLLPFFKLAITFSITELELHSARYHRERRTISPKKRYKQSRIHHIQRPCLDFEKMQQVSRGPNIFTTFLFIVTLLFGTRRGASFAIYFIKINNLTSYRCFLITVHMCVFLLLDCILFKWEPWSCVYVICHILLHWYVEYLKVDLAGATASNRKQEEIFAYFFASAWDWTQFLSVMSLLPWHLSHHTLLFIITLYFYDFFSLFCATW